MEASPPNLGRGAVPTRGWGSLNLRLAACPERRLDGRMPHSCCCGCGATPGRTHHASQAESPFAAAAVGAPGVTWGRPAGPTNNIATAQSPRPTAVAVALPPHIISGPWVLKRFTS